MLKLNVGFNRKTGEANYGCRGASVSLELECDGGLIDQPDRLRERVRYLFGLAKASVEEELASQGANCHAPASGSSNGAHQANGHRRDGARPATASQVRALLAIAKRLRLDATNVAQSRYGVDTPQDLSITEASELIDDLKSRSGGAGGRR